jgi:hypothetical protein
MNNLSAISTDNWDMARKLLAAGLVVGSIYLSVLAAMWFVGDFVAMAANSHGLDASTQTGGFSDFSYISNAMQQVRFNLGIIALTMAIAMAMQAVLFLQPQSISIALFVAGGTAMILQVALLFSTFYWSVFLFFVLTTLGLYLTIELGDRIHHSGEEDDEEEPEEIKLDEMAESAKPSDQDEPKVDIKPG